ncbi:patatin-like phospholipase family protein [Pseudomonas aeruginosa]|nr:patatin-like phospholipase family protein [Pseudomonas aeruginosa]
MRRLLLVLLLLLPLSALAAEARPKIGLVLSGGAARGLAHIGVLKALDEQGIQIDAIAGTSMGAVVGGLYASGYTPPNWSASPWRWTGSRRCPTRRRARTCRSGASRTTATSWSSRRSASATTAPSACRWGVIQGQNLAMVLESLLVHTSDNRDFDKLAIPFRAVSTDIATGEKVVFRKGHLPQAIRASMSIPAVFAPVEIDGRLLVDGGMVDNIPVDVARDMGVDVVIVVDIGNRCATART